MDTPTVTPALFPPLPPIRPGYRTTEFWLSAAAMLLSGAYAVGLIPTDGVWAKIAALMAFVLTSSGYTIGRSMVKAATMVLVCGMMLMSGCGTLEKKAVAANIDGAFMRVNPATTELMIGEGTVSMVDAPVKAGQCFKYASKQYAPNSSNLWFESTFEVEAAVDGTACVTTEPVPFFKLLGLSMYDPWSPSVMTVRMVPDKATDAPPK